MKDITVLHGHFHFPEIQHLTGPQTKLVTWLREPADRVISNYYFLMFRIQSGKVKPEQRDKQSYSLMDYAKMDSQKNVMKKFLGDSDLDDYFFAGDFHEYAKEINHLLNRLGYKGKVPEIHENKTHDLNIYKLCTTQPGDITDTMKDEIREMNQADIHLYNTMLELKKRRGEPEAALNKRTH